jgi:hypothetical protein
MQTFAFLTLVVILIATNQLLNWAVRKIWKNGGSDAGLFIFLTCVIYGIFLYANLKYLILWGYPLFV